MLEAGSVGMPAVLWLILVSGAVRPHSTRDWDPRGRVVKVCPAAPVLVMNLVFDVRAGCA